MYKSNYRKSKVKTYNMFNNYNKSYYNTRRRRRAPNGRVLLVVLVVVLLVALGLFIAFTSMGPKADPVSELKAVKITDNSLTLKWKGGAESDGYNVYQRLSDKDEFKKLTVIKSKKTQSFNVEKLNSSTEYEFKVTGYIKDKKDKKKLIESSDSLIKAFVRPNATEIDKVETVGTNSLNIEWKSVKGAKDYQIQYEKGIDPEFKNQAKKLTVKTNKASVKNLEENASYSLRLRYSVAYNDEKVYSPWSDVITTFIAENVVISSQIDPNKPMVALTFDDGPGFNKASDKILDTLEKYHSKATFFMVGYNASKLPKNIKRKAQLGMELGNHTWNHKHYGEEVTASDIKKASDTIYKICGKYPTAFRSPGGITTDVIKEECKKEGMALYYRSIDTEDWRTRNASKTIKSVIDNVQDGDIILMHEIYDTTAQAVEKLVPKLIKRGYQLVTCNEIVTARSGKAPTPGLQYINGTNE
jgi:peptidoglycan/xylan/chitin deacetylase (PgdA/CDA1 family)